MNNSQNISEHLHSYVDAYYEALRNIDLQTLDQVKSLLLNQINNKKWIFFIGNGGSAEIANHMECDHLKGISSNTIYKPKVNSLSNKIGLITAIANDIDYAEVFRFQIEKIAEPGDLLFAISSSGNSKNIINAIEVAKSLELVTVSLTGFDGGEAKKIADYNLHINSNNYGVVEDAHQSLLHILAQSIRLDGINDVNIKQSIKL
jgi:D-sedoheptulose 7-phosphate isomerase